MRDAASVARRRWSRLLTGFVAVTLIAGLTGQVPAFAASEAHKPLQPQRARSVPAGRAPAGPAKHADPGAAAALKSTPAVSRWPAPGTAVVDLATVRSTSGVAAADSAGAGTLPVRVGRTQSAGRKANAAGTPGRVRVQVLDHTAAVRTGHPVLLRVGRADQVATPARAQVSVDYQGFRAAYGADWSTRLRLVQLPECALTTPLAAACQPSPLPSTNNVRSGTVSADVTLPATSGVLLAVGSDPSGGAGDYTATKLAPSSTWQAGGSAGDFTWSYPMRVPVSLGGPQPDLALSYDAQSVDGHTAASNNQPSWVGEGFDYQPGSITRGYKACADDMDGNANNSTKTGDVCWATPNATLSLSGHSGELIRDDGTGAWHLKADDGTRIEHLTGVSNGDETFDSNGNRLPEGEHWRVTTTDGTQFYFGLNRLDGWTAGKAVTNSVYTVPVFGNNPNEPCHGSSFASSWCQQAWLWNLDYVVDVNGNTESFWYTPETNNYARNDTVSTVSTYTRGGHLDRIDYGSDNRSGTDTEYTGKPPMQVVFNTLDRCLPNTTCDSAHPDNWPDVPWDQNCAVTTSCTIASPTFWTQKRLASVTTRVWNASVSDYKDVEQWTLNHAYLDPGDGTRAGLWLAGISHKGLAGGAVAVPDVTFTGYQMANRVNVADPKAPPMKWWRIAYINTEAGGVIGVTYYPVECVTGSNMPASADNNTKRCFPAYWTRPTDTTPTIDWFHKYVVHQVTETDTVRHSPRTIVNYDYPSPPAWHYDSDDGLVPAARKTWAQWRGYDKVNVTTGDPGEQTYTSSRFFRGMDGDHLSTGGARSVSVDGIADDDAYAGMTRQSQVFNGPGGAEVSSVTDTPWKSAARSTRTIADVPVYARLSHNGAVVQSHTDLDGGRAPRTSTVTTTFDGTYGYPTQVADNGDDAIATTDDRCTINTYASNTAAWLIGAVTRVQQYVLPCGQTPATAHDVISDTRTYYDGQAFGAAPTKGNVTQTESAKAWTSPTNISYLVVGRAGYDPYGRLVDSWDVRGNNTNTAYTPATGGPITKIVNKTPLLWTSTTDLDPLLGQPLDTVDVNGQTTRLTYDPLGRLTSVWLPGSAKANTTYAYTVATSGSSVKTSTLNAAGNYVIDYQLYDGMLRPTQTQSPAAVTGTGRVITDTFYNTAGQVVKTNNPYYNTDAGPGTTLFSPQDNHVPSQVVTSYDGAGRAIAQILYKESVEQWRGISSYGGDYTSTTPAAGGTPTTTFSDVRGKTVQLRQYHGASPTGAYDTTGYQYSRKGQLQSVTDPVGNHWTYAYDMFSRVTSATDPDTSTSTSGNTYEYNDAGDLLTGKDSRGTTLAYRYDSIGRLTDEFDTSTSGTKLAAWTYDTAPMPDGTGAKGQPASATRYASGNAYSNTVRGYTATYQPTGVNIVIPSSEDKLAGTYTYTYTYNVDSSLNSLRIPAGGGLTAEVLTYTYDSTTGLPTKLSSNYGGVITPTTLVSGTAYTEFGEPSVTSYSTGGKIAQQGLYYDPATRRITETLTDRETAPSIVTDAHYWYDPAGDVTKIADTPSSGTADTQCFTHDYLQRLTQAWTPGNGDCNQTPSNTAMGGPAPYWQNWTIDLAGNRKSQTDHNTGAGEVTTSYTYPAAGAVQPHTLTGTTTTDNTGTRAASYSYDTAGNTKSQPGPHGQQTLTWDIEGHLATLADSAETNSYVYDTSGNRLISHDPGGATLHLGVVELRLAKGATASTATRYYSFNGQTFAQRSSSGLTWLTSDLHGTADTAIDATTQAVTHRRFTPYGAPRGSNPTWANDKGYLGGTQDPTGLTHEGAREYDPSTGRFISIDPVFESGDPQQMGGYAYAANSPITSSDPSGLFLPAPEMGNPDQQSTADKAGAFAAGLVTGWNDAGKNLAHHLWQTIRHPRDAVQGMADTYNTTTAATGGNGAFGLFCAVTGLCDAVTATVNEAKSGDWHGAGYTTGDYVGEQLTIAAATYAIAKGIGVLVKAAFGAAEAGADATAARAAAGTPKTDPVAPKPDIGDGGKPAEPPSSSGASGGAKPNTGAGQGTAAAGAARLGEEVPALGKTWENHGTYLTNVADHYGINLRGVTPIWDYSLRMGQKGLTRPEDGGWIIRIHSGMVRDEADLANTLAHELHHARDFQKGRPTLEPPAYGAGDALEEWIYGLR